MISSNLKALISRLNPVCKQATEGAAGLCLSFTHYEVDLEHILLKLLDNQGTDLHAILRHYDIHHAHVSAALTRALRELKTGNTRTPVLSPYLPSMFERAWVLASVDYGQAQARSAHLLLSMLCDHELGARIKASAPDLNRIDVAQLRTHLPDMTARSIEAPSAPPLQTGESSTDSATLPDAQRLASNTPCLDQYTINLTQRAKEGRLDPVRGRDREIRQLIDILMRRRQNNPILTGEAGVGKTAVVEGLAIRIAQGNVPSTLSQVALHTLDLGLLQAGASVRGEFESRLKGVIDEVKRSAHPIVVFIDEAHTLIGAGGATGQGDAANLLKPALARGEMRTIAATTYSEYKKYFEKDAALARRFQVVKVEEPSEQQAVDMLRGIADKMERHHGVRILDEAITEAVRLSHRYLSGRQLPDKAVSVLDTACARAAIARAAVPALIEDTRHRIQALETELHALRRELATDSTHQTRIDELDAQRSQATKELADMEARWERERNLVEQIARARARLESGLGQAGEDSAATLVSLDEIERRTLRAQLDSLRAELDRTQGESPLIPVCVNGQAVAHIIAAWTGVPVGKMLRNEIETTQNLQSLLEERVIGQSHALQQIARHMRTARAHLEDPNKPIAVYLLVGPSGVGKTQTAAALSDILYGGERNMITINMSEYQEPHTVSGLKGSPPGYVGYGEGGVLTEAVRRKPYSVVLLDEIEKAHPDVMELFFQVFDKGVMDDAEGREIDFRNTVIILTSNVGTDTIMRHCVGVPAPPDPEALCRIIQPDLRSVFKPAFLGRLTVVPYYPLPDAVMRQIVELKLNRVRQRIAQTHRAAFDYEDSLVTLVASRCTELDSGARNVDHILNGTLLPSIADHVLARMAEGEPIARIHLSVGTAGQVHCDVN